MSDARKDENDELEGTEAPFVSHLIELRDRLIRSLIAIVAVFGVLCIWPGTGAMYDILAAPLTSNLPEGTKLIATSVFSPFMVPLKITLLVGFLAALPYVLYQTWAFVAPGLYSHEKRLVVPLVVSSTLLFFAGVAFCYFVVIPGLTKFIVAMTPASVNAAPDIEQYFGTVITLFLVFGIAFEVPVAVVVLARIGVISVEQLRKWRGYFIVGSFVVAAIVTPPDVISQLALAVPMCILYEIGILIASATVKKKKKAADDEDAAAAADDKTA
ncbi:MAG: twin-arginine translocase subunit TatC [Rubrivivax sp.]|nr:twin-arginine translocase subunit TatC [Rubrivivax sp.]